jgi:DNA-binding CsgD family transcriptional regulator
VASSDSPLTGHWHTTGKGHPVLVRPHGQGGISQREAEVLAALGEHLSNAQIANRLHISVRTVETHVSSLLRKLGAADRWMLAAAADRVSAASPASSRPFSGLPATSTTFVGRAWDRDAVIAALADSRLVTTCTALRRVRHPSVSPRVPAAPADQNGTAAGL